MSKAPFIAVLVALAAFLLGRWAPNRDLRAAKAEIEQLREMAGRAGGSRGGGGMEGVTRMLQIPAARPAPVETNLVEAAGTSTNAPPRQARLTPEERRQRLHDRIAEAKELWGVRSDLIRESFLSRLPGHGDHNARNFDVLVSAMNIRVDYAVSNWVERVKTKDELRPEDGARLFHEITGAIVQTYDAMDEKLPPNWREAAGPDFQLFELIDPKAGERLLEVDGLISEREDFGPPPRGER
ncbi:MAG: hypothetical protein U1G05_06920 [Kiritimatiellia bacterium]